MAFNETIETLVPMLAVVLPFIGLLVSKRFEKKETKESAIDDRFSQLEERVNMSEFKIAKLEGRLNGR